jgi:hypothetical protein
LRLSRKSERFKNVEVFLFTIFGLGESEHESRRT